MIREQSKDQLRIGACHIQPDPAAAQEFSIPGFRGNKELVDSGSQGYRHIHITL